MDMVNKENAIKDYLAMIKQSWTWAKLTEEEKECFETFQQVAQWQNTELEATTLKDGLYLTQFITLSYLAAVIAIRQTGENKKIK